MSDGGLALARSLYPRVSTILADSGLSKPYPDGVPAVEWGRARGTAVHKAIALAQEGLLDETRLHPDVAGPFQAYKAFVADTGYQADAWEEPVYHDALRLRGTLDSRGRGRFTLTLEGYEAVIDFKCSKQPDLEAAAYQLAAYAMALDGISPTTMLPRFVVQLGDEHYRIHDVTNPKAITIFEAACIVWHAKMEGL